MPARKCCVTGKWMIPATIPSRPARISKKKIAIFTDFLMVLKIFVIYLFIASYKIKIMAGKMISYPHIISKNSAIFKENTI